MRQPYNLEAALEQTTDHHERALLIEEAYLFLGRMPVTELADAPEVYRPLPAEFAPPDMGLLHQHL